MAGAIIGGKSFVPMRGQELFEGARRRSRPRVIRPHEGAGGETVSPLVGRTAKSFVPMRGQETNGAFTSDLTGWSHSSP